MTTVEDALVLAHIFECAARGMEIDFEKVDPKSPKGAEEHYRSVFDKLVGDLEFIKSKARSAAWKPEVVEKLSCFSVRPESIDDWQKDSIRYGCNGCMACGRTEECNFKAISLFGYCCKQADQGRPMFTSFDGLCDDYTAAFDAYNQVLIDAGDRRKERRFVDGFHPQDGGMLVLGETCHNRALLYNIASNFIFNWVFIADSYLQGMRELGKKKVKDSKLYMSLREDAENIKKSLEVIKGLATIETASVSSHQLSIDAEWWRRVQVMRGNKGLLDASKEHFEKWSDYYRKMGFRGLSPWSTPAKPPEKPTSRKQGNCDSPSSSTQDGASARKRKPDDPPAEEQHDKRAKIRDGLVRIKNAMVERGALADALVLMEALLELKD